MPNKHRATTLGRVALAIRLNWPTLEAEWDEPRRALAVHFAQHLLPDDPGMQAWFIEECTQQTAHYTRSASK